jgi:murein DD-endopeptidase MepM/ murein hydrolase activator NlpD
MVLATLVAALLAAGAAAGDPGTDKARIDARIGDLRARADEATQSEGVLSTELSGLEGRVRDAEASVDAEQARLAELEASLAAERAHLVSLERTIATQTARLAVLRRQYEKALGVLERHLRALYEADDPDLIGVALGVRSFTELLDTYDLLNSIGRQDERIATTLEDAHTRLQRTRAATEQAKFDAVRSEATIAAGVEAQRITRDRMVASRDALLAARREKSDALSQVQEDKASFIAEAESLSAQSAALAARIAAAQQAAQAATSTSSAPPPSNGQLGWPVAGPVTSGFGSRWGRMHEGIDIGVPEGTPVHAAAAGTVIYAGWMSGYGNIVVIDHGNGISTAYAHNSQLIVGQSATVGKGFVIALSGNTGHSTGPHVHFEVRVNGTPVDPLGYL